LTQMRFDLGQWMASDILARSIPTALAAMDRKQEIPAPVVGADRYCQGAEQLERLPGARSTTVELEQAGVNVTNERAAKAEHTHTHTQRERERERERERVCGCVCVIENAFRLSTVLSPARVNAFEADETLVHPMLIPCSSTAGSAPVWLFCSLPARQSTPTQTSPYLQRYPRGPLVQPRQQH
jgi:hypothetical protein